MPLLLILVPLFAVIILNLLFKLVRKQIAFWFGVILFSIQIVLIILQNPFFHRGEFVSVSRFFSTVIYIDGLSFIVLLCIETVCLASLVVARYTLSDLGQRFNFINLLILASIGMSGVVMTRDLFSLYVFMEVTAVASFILISFRRGRASLEGAFKYLVLSAIATVLMLSSIALILLTSGNLDFLIIRESIAHVSGSPIVLFAAAIFICGLFIKAGLVPFHGWLPDAYEAAPAPVSVLLAGAVTKVCGIYTLMRLVAGVFNFTHPVNQILLFIGAVSIIFGALAAIGQSDFKRMLAYSSISQTGYIVLGLGCANPLGFIGAAFHFFNHSFFKSLLFVNAASVGEQTGTTNMDTLGGLSKKMPVTGATTMIGFLSAAGVPPLAGFWSKLIIVVGLFQASRYGYAAIAIVASVLTLAYFLSMNRRVFFGELVEGVADCTEAPLGLLVVAIVLACVIVCSGLFFPLLFHFGFTPVIEVFRDVI